MITDYPQFEALAQHHGGHAKKYDQKNYLDVNPFTPGTGAGVCRALSAAYIIRNRRNAIIKDSTQADEDVKSIASGMDNLNFNEAYNYMTDNSLRTQIQKDKFTSIAKAQVDHNAFGMFNDHQPLIKAARDTVKDLSNGLLQYKTFVPVVTFGAGVTENALPGDGQWLISTGIHMMAVVIRTQAAKGGKYKFFDPNFGQAFFPDKNSLKSFLNEFLHAQQYEESYFISFI